MTDSASATGCEVCDRQPPPDVPYEVWKMTPVYAFWRMHLATHEFARAVAVGMRPLMRRHDDREP